VRPRRNSSFAAPAVFRCSFGALEHPAALGIARNTALNRDWRGALTLESECVGALLLETALGLEPLQVLVVGEAGYRRKEPPFRRRAGTKKGEDEHPRGGPREHAASEESIGTLHPTLHCPNAHRERRIRFMNRPLAIALGEARIPFALHGRDELVATLRG